MTLGGESNGVFQSPRVRFVVGFLQPRHTNMRVDLCRRQAGVTQQLLNAPQIGAAVQKVSGERVPPITRS